MVSCVKPCGDGKAAIIEQVAIEAMALRAVGGDVAGNVDAVKDVAFDKIGDSQRG